MLALQAYISWGGMSIAHRWIIPRLSFLSAALCSPRLEFPQLPLLSQGFPQSISILGKKIHFPLYNSFSSTSKKITNAIDHWAKTYTLKNFPNQFQQTGLRIQPSTTQPRENQMFDYMLVSKEGNIAYCIGTKAYCAEYALKRGIRATTEIIYCPEN